MIVNDSFQEIAIAVVGGIIAIVLVALWHQISGWMGGQIRRVYRRLIAIAPILRHVAIGVMGAVLAILLMALIEDARNMNMRLLALEDRDVQVQTGSITLDPRDPGYSSLTEVGLEDCPKERGRRGDLNGRVSFPEPFLSPPKVLIAFSIIETDLEPGNRGTRLVVEATHVDKEGFNYDLYTWCNGQVWWVRASWMAVGKIGSYPLDTGTSERRGT